jgi:putative transposase
LKHRRPPHLYFDNHWYMITASTYQRIPHLASLDKAHYFRRVFQKLAVLYNLHITAWVILPDHYHILLKPSRGRTLATFMQRLHGSTSRQFNLWDSAIGRSVWYSYWDTCIRDDAGYWTRFNYIHYNPVKHGFVTQPEQWGFSSYREYADRNGAGWIQQIMLEYPVQSVAIADEVAGEAD